MPDTNNDDAPFGWDSPEEQERAAFLETDTGEDVCYTVPDDDLQNALGNALQHMDRASVMFVPDGLVGQFRFEAALIAVAGHVRDAHCLSPECMKLALTTIGTVLDRLRWYAEDRAPASALPGLRVSVERLGEVVADLHKIGGLLAEQIELDRKRAKHRRRR